MDASRAFDLSAHAQATDYIFRETTFPIYMVPLDVCDKLPIPGTFMETRVGSVGDVVAASPRRRRGGVVAASS